MSLLSIRALRKMSRRCSGRLGGHGAAEIDSPRRGLWVGDDMRNDCAAHLLTALRGVPYQTKG